MNELIKAENEIIEDFKERCYDFQISREISKPEMDKFIAVLKSALETQRNVIKGKSLRNVWT